MCKIETVKKENQTLPELDHDTSNNKIGEIVNLSQKLNSLIWDKIHKGESEEKIKEIYGDVCKLAVLSGLEIDKAKRACDIVNVGKELIALRKKYDKPSPVFFQEIDESSKEKQYIFYDTAMDYVYAIASKIHFRKGREQVCLYRPISEQLAYNLASGNATEYRHKDKIVGIIDDVKAKTNRLYMELRTADEQEREVIYAQISDIKTERDKLVNKWLTNENVLMLVLRHYEKNSSSDWRIYAALINHPVFSDLLFELYDRFPKIEENESGKYLLYGRKFAKNR